MRLVRISEDHSPWQVLAIETEPGRTVWDQLQGEGWNKQTRRLAGKMRARIKDMSRNGPPRHGFQGTMLGGTGGIGELRLGPKRGKKLRVLWFYGRERQIIVTHAFWKGGDVAPSDIATAQDWQKRYREARERTVTRLQPRGTQ